MSDGCAKQYRSTQTPAIPLSGHSVRMGFPVHVQTKDSGGCRVLWGVKEECPNRVLWNWGTFWELCFGLRLRETIAQYSEAFNIQCLKIIRILIFWF